jgi:hypothetical protein
MSISSILQSINHINKEIAQLEKDLAIQTKKETDIRKKINDIQKSITERTPPSIIQSKQRQIEKYNNELVRISAKKADINMKIVQKRERLNDLNKKLQKEQLRESQTLQKNYENRIKQLTRQFDEAIASEISRAHQNVFSSEKDGEQYDVFISHASEDKETFVRDLAETLKNKYNIKVWYDEFSMKWGDSLRETIDKGLKSSKFGIVVISRNFINKGWTQYELDGLLQKEMTHGKTILPIWHNITKDEVYKFSPSLAGRVALNTAMLTVDEIAQELINILNEGKK